MSLPATGEWRFRYGVAVTFGFRAAGIGAMALASIIAARFLGPSGRGELAVVGLVSSLAMQFGNLGLHTSTTHFAARDPETVPRIAAFSLAIALVAGTALSLLVVAVWWFFPQSLNEIPARFLFIPVAVIPFGLVSQLFQSILLGMQRIVAFNVMDLAGKALGLAATVVVVSVFGLGVWELLLAGMIFTISSSLLTVWLVLRGAYSLLKMDFALARDMLRYGMKSYLACLFAFLLIRADLLMVNYFSGTGEAGWYAVAVSFTDLLYLFPAAIATVLFPRVSSGQDENGALTTQVSRNALTVYGLLCLLTGVLATPLIRLIYGAPFLPAVGPLVWLLPGIFMLGMLNIYAQHFAGTGFPVVTVVVWIPAFLLNVLLNLFWIPAFGMVGAAWSSSLCYGGLAVFHLWYFLRLTGRRLAEVLIPHPDEVRGLANIRGLF